MIRFEADLPKFSKEEGRLDLWIDFVKGAKFPCPACDQTQEGEVHDTQDRTWRHLNFFQYETYLHAWVPRGGVVNGQRKFTPCGH